MASKLKINPTTGRLDLVETIPQLDYDPFHPRAEDAWILKRSIVVPTEIVTIEPVGFGLLFTQIVTTEIPALELVTAGSPMGFSLLFTYPEDGEVIESTDFQYHFSYRTRQGTTLRMLLEEDDPYLDPNPPLVAPEFGTPIGFGLLFTISDPDAEPPPPPITSGAPFGFLFLIMKAT